jgi:exopolysaccharide biosynthesis polyprenyl glycosylphosphotransferase
MSQAASDRLGPSSDAPGPGRPPATSVPAPGGRLTEMRLVETELETAAGTWRLRGPGMPDYAAPRPARRAGDLTRVDPGWRRRYTATVVAADLFVAGTVGMLVGAPGRQTLTALGLAAGLMLVLVVGRVYEHGFIGHGGDELRRGAVAGLVLLTVVSMLAVALPGLDAQALVLIGVPVAAAGSLAVHAIARLVLGALRRRGRCLQRVVAVGLERSVADLVRSVRREPGQGFEVVAACVTSSQQSEIDGVAVLGPPEQLPRVLVASGADTVVLTAWSDVSQEQLRRLQWDIEGSGVQLLVAPRLSGVTAPRIRLRTVGGVPLLRVDEPEFTGVRRVGKIVLDAAMALLLVLAALPAMVVVGLAVRLTSPGPVFFRQDRVGKNGVTFRMHKFRSMYVDAEQRLEALRDRNEQDGPLFKMKDDPRVTPVGGFIRRFSLDELPQLLDVMLGRMSLIGPRPPLVAEVAEYGVEMRRRLRVKPGITGLWQVSGRSDLSWEDAVRLDLHYVENWSLLLDLSILLRTARAVLARSGAY